MKQFIPFLKAGLISAFILLGGCATTSTDVNDPLEPFNRAMYSFNDVVDTVVLRPVAKGYDAITPSPIQRGVSNFFSNLNEITVVINDLLQLKFGQALHDSGRFLLNSTVGFAGVFDVAGYAGHKKNNEDFGQSLGAWGVESGPYVVLPFFGPRTVRDTAGLVCDLYTNPVTYIDDVRTRNAFTIANIVSTRTQLFGAEKILEQATSDEYSYVRDAYLQRRQNLVYDGDAPEEDFDLFDDE